MKQNSLLWIAAFLITVASASYQRMTGPSYPLKGSAQIAGKVIPYQLVRSHGGTTDCAVEVKTIDEGIRGTLSWKRYKTDDAWTDVPMTFTDGTLSALLPNQPPAGKLEYRVTLNSNGQQANLPEEGSNVIRFKGEVPLWVLIPHVFCMFCGMLFSTRAGIEFIRKERNLKPLVIWTLGFLAFGGFILGPLVQKFAFDAYWTGWPFGHDLTDNKTAVAIIAWLVVLFMLKRSPRPERWAIGASIVTLAVFMIPHSVLGSELKYDNVPKPKP